MGGGGSVFIVHYGYRGILTKAAGCGSLPACRAAYITHGIQFGKYTPSWIRYICSTPWYLLPTPVFAERECTHTARPPTRIVTIRHLYHHYMPLYHHYMPPVSSLYAISKSRARIETPFQSDTLPDSRSRPVGRHLYKMARYVPIFIPLAPPSTLHHGLTDKRYCEARNKRSTATCVNYDPDASY